MVAENYPLTAFNTTPFPAFSALVRIRTETSFLCPTYHGLRTAAEKGIPAYAYLWGHTPTCPWYDAFTAAALPILGAAHTAEIPYVFANTQRNPPPDGECSFTAAERALSEEIVAFWTSMAASGTPGGGWPQFGGAEGGTTGLIVEDGASSGTVGRIGYEVCEFWERVRDLVVQGSNGMLPGNGTVAPGNGSLAPVPGQEPVPYEGGVTRVGANGLLAGGFSVVATGWWLWA